jgi:hypothetical protein
VRQTVATASLVPLLLALACTHPEQTAKRAPAANLKIHVEIDGQPLPTINAARLSGTPDLEDEHRQAWKLARIVPELAGARQLVVEHSDRQRVVLPLDGDDRAAANIALVLNRKGEVVLAELNPADPFPAFHGRGGNRGRAPGEKRIRDLEWLRLRSRPSARSDQSPQSH